LKEVKREAHTSPTELLVSLDTKAVVKVGEFSRRGQSRIPTKAQDHDHQPDALVTPLGILLPEHQDLHLFMSTSKVTSDCIVDCIDTWWTEMRPRFPDVKKLVFLQDNGPQNSGRRTQFLKRMVDFSHGHQIDVRLAYYPPYHSKYNPIERCWGALEHHWNGSLLDSINATVEFAKSMKWHSRNPIVTLLKKTYETGVKLSKKAMKEIEKQLVRLPGLEPWFIDISGAPT
jgi:hypothetical protein